MRAQLLSLGLTLAALSLASLAPRDALAFCRTTTCDKNCAPDRNGCATRGEYVYWPDACVTYAVPTMPNVTTPPTRPATPCPLAACRTSSNSTGKANPV